MIMRARPACGLAESLHLPRRVKQYEKVLTRIGQLRQRYARVARYYAIRLEKDEASGNAKALVWMRIVPTEDTLPGVYCLRTNQADWDETTLWHTYTMLTDLEAVFRSLKSELGLRPIHHHKDARVDGHLFIAVLAYHLVHTLRIQLKAQGIHLSWESAQPVRGPRAGHRRAPPRRWPDLPHPQSHPARTPPAGPLQRPGPSPPTGQDREDAHRSQHRRLQM